MVGGFVCLVLTGCGPDGAGGGDTSSVRMDTSQGDGDDLPDTGEDVGADVAFDGGFDAGADTESHDVGDTGKRADVRPDGDAGGTKLFRLFAAVQTGMNSSKYAVAEVGDGQVGARGLLAESTYGSGDIAVDSSDGRVFVLNRRCSGPAGSSMCMAKSGEVIEVSLDGNSMFAVDATFEQGSGAYNPQGVGYVKSKSPQAYFVSSYFDSKVFVHHETRKSHSKSYDTAPFDAGATMTDDDPEVSDIVVDGDYVLVNLQRLSGFMPKKKSALAVIDTKNETFLDFDTNTTELDPLTLPAKNSFAGLKWTGGGNLAVGMTGGFGMQDGQIAIIERKSAGDYSVGNTVVTEMELGGDINGFAMVSDTEGYALVSSSSGGSFSTKLKHFTSGASGATVKTISAIENASGAICMTPDRSQVWVADGDTAHAGLWGVDTASNGIVNSKALDFGGTVRSCVVK